ncbi:hypothetical protein SUDANB51_04725 [Streptomyces sp. enrichment culture]
MSYGDQVCAWVTRLHEGLWFAARHPDTDVAHKNLWLYADRLRDIVLPVADRAPPPGGETPRAYTPAYECLPETKMFTP